MACDERRKLKPNRNNRLQRQANKEAKVVDIKDASKRYLTVLDVGYIPSKKLIRVGHAEIYDMITAFEQMKFMVIDNDYESREDKNYFLLEKYLASYNCKKPQPPKAKAHGVCAAPKKNDTQNVANGSGDKANAQPRLRRRISVKKLRAEAEKRRSARDGSVEIKHQAPVSRKRTREEFEEEFQNLNPKVQKLLLRRRMEMLRARIMSEEQK